MTPPMTTSKNSSYAPGDIVVVPFPYSDQFAEKRRPALVVSNARLHSEGCVWIVMITSALHSRLTHDVEIDDLTRAGLSSPSIIRPAKIANVEPARIIRRAGRLKAQHADIVFDAVKSFIGR